MKLKPAKPYYNVDPVTKQVVSDAIFDGYLDEAMAVNSRFGLEEFTDLGTGTAVDGLFWWDKNSTPVCVSGGRAFTFDQNGTVAELFGGDWQTGTPATFADGQKVDGSCFLYACNGGKLNYSTGGGFATAPSPAPQASTHVVYNGLRFLANEAGTARFSFSDIDLATGEFDPLYWGAVENPLTADSRGDNVSGLYQAWDDIAVWGSKGRELWQVTGGEPPLQVRSGAFSEAGLLAPYSVQKADNTFFALCVVDGKPAVIRLQGNDPQVISLPIEKVLDSFTTLNDAIGDMVSAGGQSFYLLTFPTENQTWVYSVKSDYWCQWSYWNQTYAQREAFIGRHFIYARQWGMHLCASRTDGRIFRVVPEANTDAGNIIRTEWQTGWIDGETTRNKTLDMLRLHVKRGQGGETGNEPVLTFRYRDNGNLEWSNERQISLGKQGQNEFYRTLRALGMFRSRQFSYILTDPAKLVLVDMDIEITKLGN